MSESGPSTRDFMLSYWHGWWRFMWHWADKPLKRSLNYGHHNHPYANCGNYFLCFSIYRLNFCFSCETIAEARARYDKMFSA